MADINARQRQLIGSPAEWSTNDMVLASGEIGVEMQADSTAKIKIGDGTKPFSQLPYLVAPGGGGTTGKQPYSGTIAPFTFNNASGPRMGVTLNADGWNTQPSTLRIQFEVTGSNYFASNPNGHWAVALRHDPALFLSDTVGQGIAVGNATGYPGGASDVNPTAMLETFAKNGSGFPTGNDFLWVNSSVGRTKKLQDGVKYRFVVESVILEQFSRFLRYKLMSFNPGTAAWTTENDTGYVYDHNTSFNYTDTGVLFAHVFESNLGQWSLAFENATYTWDHPPGALMDTTPFLSRYGADLQGELFFRGPQRINTNATSGVDLAVNGATAMNFSSAGISFPGSSARVGQTEPTFTGLGPFNGYHARNFTDNIALNFETLCTDGNIRNFMAPTPTNEQVEHALRPIYCTVSVLIGILKARKVI